MFDYIVAGGGTAGCTLASRLTENPGARVLLIEAGPPDRGREIHIPSAFPGLPLKWKDTTEPQAHLHDRRLSWTRGKVLGGGGSIGAMIHLRGCRADYDSWRDLGNVGWGFDDLQPLFAASSPDHEEARTEPNLLTTAFLDACQTCQIPRYHEFQGPGDAGAGLFPLSQRKHGRWSAVDAVLRPALGRGNLTVWTGIQVARVVIEGGRAMGVEYLHRGSRVQVGAAREVILCAGAVGSSQLLLLSGIGPAKQLESLGIPVVAGLPGVGENLQDHLAVALSYSCTQPVSISGLATRMNTWKYRTRKQGPLGSNLLEAGAFAKSKPELTACDLEVLFAPLGSLERGMAPPAEHGFSLFATVLTPKSRGRVVLASADPLTPPHIDPAFLSDAEDRELQIKAIALARRIAESGPFSAYRGAAAAFEWEDTARSLYDCVGGCKMGQDEASVVDSELQIHGVAGLRVADASIMPVIPRAHPAATVMVIAEKAARLIRG